MKNTAQKVKAHNMKKWTVAAIRPYTAGRVRVAYINDQIILFGGRKGLIVSRFDPATKTVKPVLTKMTDRIVTNRRLTLVKTHESLTLMKEHELA